MGAGTRVGIRYRGSSITGRLLMTGKGLHRDVYTKCLDMNELYAIATSKVFREGMKWER